MSQVQHLLHRLPCRLRSQGQAPSSMRQLLKTAKVSRHHIMPAKHIACQARRVRIQLQHLSWLDSQRGTL